MCETCDFNIALMNYDQTCSLCREDANWKFDNDLGRCRCDEFLNSNGGNLCQTCDQLIPGCNSCEQTDSPGNSLKVEVGYDDVLSPRPGNFVICTDCGKGMLLDPVTNECKFCKDRFAGCADCKADGSACTECDYGYFKITEQSANCRTCDFFGMSCKECDTSGC